MEIEMPSAPQRVPIGRVAQIALFALVIVLVMIVIFWRPEKMNTDAQSAGETPQAQFEERSLPRQQPLVVTTTRDTKGREGRWSPPFARKLT